MAVVLSTDPVPDDGDPGVLSADEIAFAGRYLGADFEQVELAGRLARLGSIEAAVEEQLRTVYAGFATSPASISLPGDYSQQTGENLRALRDVLNELPAPPGGGGAGSGRLTRTDRR